MMTRLEEIKARLRTDIGLDVESIGESALRRLITHRARELELALEEYLNVALHSPKEMQALIEEVVVPETWFFRDPGAFVYLPQLAGEMASMRVLSAPCATGEEAFSVAIALENSGVTSFEVFGWDLSVEAIRHAKRAPYGKRSFRSEIPDGERYLQRVGEEMEIIPTLRQLIFDEV